MSDLCIRISPFQVYAAAPTRRATSMPPGFVDYGDVFDSDIQLLRRADPGDQPPPADAGPRPGQARLQCRLPPGGPGALLPQAAARRVRHLPVARVRAVPPRAQGWAAHAGTPADRRDSVRALPQQRGAGGPGGDGLDAPQRGALHPDELRGYADRRAEHAPEREL